ncbi:MAG: TonB-dependent receptor plug domain-containing protein [Acidobacteria bacterium]|nr:TonB-dependent receptor plug domain-containing protein [Acidobacteriota bacterium]NIM60677.1 TonB-dependent receptor plug domain-containing protein [Acidobacteriota bacterium]NIO58637.1 TonB-dependent receptor plug domain-containing protein [Acidobacteriota bacterium]NIQ29693.1 TonB-dependent receptor plug domain-containing protein [Acidobacteriota bacterium]NIQ84410.1 TonB-dependent receptor plug domain-containing protein [Acidobacteriota bacterium]
MKIQRFWVVGLVSLLLLPLSAADDGGRELDVLEMESLKPIASEIAPGATHVITAEEIEASGVANIFELLRFVPGMDVRYTPMGGFVSIRGSGDTPFSSRLLLLIDGTPYNSPDKGGFPGHPNYNGFFPLSRIDRIEVIKGPVSTRYGSNAFDGVINIVSKKPAETVTEIDGQAFGLQLAAGERSLRQGRASIQLVRGSLEATIEAGVRHGDTPIMLNGDASHRRDDVYGAIRRGNLRVSLLTSSSRNGSFNNLGVATLPTKQRITIVDSHYERRVGEFVLRGSASINRYRGTTCGVCHNPNALPPDDTLTTSIADEREEDRRLRVSFEAERSLTRRQDISFGVESSWDSINRNVVVLPGSPSKQSSGGLYFQHQMHLNKKGLRIISGARADWFEGLDTAVSPRIGVVWESSSRPVVAHASWSNASRAPTWNDRYINQNFLPAGVAPGVLLTFQGNPAIRREEIYSTQGGVAFNLARSTTLRVDLYHNRICDRIDRVGAGYVPGVGGAPDRVISIYGNRSDSFDVRGGELTLTGSPHATFDWMGAWAYRDVDVPDTDPSAAYAPKNRIIIGARYRPAPRWTIDLRGVHTSSYLVSFPAVFGVRPQPAYELIDLALRHSYPLRDKALIVSLIGRNITDSQPFETLIDASIDTRLRGRTWILEVGARF